MAKKDESKQQDQGSADIPVAAEPDTAVVTDAVDESLVGDNPGADNPIDYSIIDPVDGVKGDQQVVSKENQPQETDPTADIDPSTIGQLREVNAAREAGQPLAEPDDSRPQGEGGATEPGGTGVTGGVGGGVADT